MSILTDQERAVLTARLAEAEKALHALMIGKSAVTVSYDGESVQFTSANEAKLQRYIADLKGQLGQGCGAYRPGIFA